MTWGKEIPANGARQHIPIGETHANVSNEVHHSGPIPCRLICFHARASNRTMDIPSLLHSHCGGLSGSLLKRWPGDGNQNQNQTRSSKLAPKASVQPSRAKTNIDVLEIRLQLERGRPVSSALRHTKPCANSDMGSAAGRQPTKAEKTLAAAPSMVEDEDDGAAGTACDGASSSSFDPKERHTRST